MAINHRPPVLASAPFRDRASQVSKAALIDLAWDLLNRMHGEEETMGTGVQQFDEAFGPIAIARNDKMPRATRAKETDFDRNLKAIEQSIRLGQTEAATPQKQSLAEAIARDHEWMRAHPMPMSPPRSSRRHGRNGHVKGGRA